MDILFVGKRSLQESAGVAGKLDGQIEALVKLGHCVWFTYMQPDGCYLQQGEDRTLLRPYRPYRPAALREPRNAARMLLAAAEHRPYDLCIIRKPLCDGAHLRALKRLKERGAVVMEEIPSYPYDAELKAEKSLGATLFLWIDRLHRGRLRRYVDFIPNYNRLDRVLGIPGIKMENAVPVKNLPAHRPPRQGDPFVMIGVAAMLFWHGFDRVIEGMARYKQAGGARPLRLYLVGDGPQRMVWRQLAQQLGLGDEVRFCGTVTGPALDTLFGESHVAISTLGWHRRGFALSNALKTREYIARGIPFVYAGDDTAASGVAGCCLQLPGDDTPLDVQALLDFYDGLDGACQTQMRAYAAAHLQWEPQMQKLVDACQGLKDG